MSTRSRPQPLEALLDRTADPVRGVVEDEPEGLGAGVVGVVATVERLCVDVRAGRDRIGRADQPTDLRREDVLVARVVRQGHAHPSLRGAIAV